MTERREIDFGLLDLVLSWTVEDIFNEDRYRYKVEKIPERFLSVEKYLSSFIFPLIEETRAQLCNSLEEVYDAPVAEIISIGEYEARSELFYFIDTCGWKSGSGIGGTKYKPRPGDIFVLSSMRIEAASDLSRQGVNYILASVAGVEMDEEAQKGYKVKVSKRIEASSGMGNICFAIYLTSITTNSRIWKGINLGTSMNSNLNIIQAVLNPKFLEEAACNTCFAEEKDAWANRIPRDLSFDLNESQMSAIFGAIAATQCKHSYSMKLVKGPPGTGKTKTIGCLLSALINMNLRTLACAPTNVAVLQLCSRLLRMVRESRFHIDENGFSFCSLGDLVLFGNKDRMFVTDDLQEIFLDFRVKRLAECLAPCTGWRHMISSLILLLEDCVPEYHMFSENERSKKKIGFMVFLRDQFKAIAHALGDCMRDLLIHLPRACFSKENIKNIFALCNLLQAFGNLLHTKDVSDKELEELFSHDALKYGDSSVTDAPTADTIFVHSTRDALDKTRQECVSILKTLQGTLNLCLYAETNWLREYCLKNATLIFCTASSSSFLHYVEMEPLEVVVIDEAAQLKECESVIPLRLKGLRHAVLIGDEHQLPAMVRSEVSREVGFGRSLFERLSCLGHHKYLLNIQYRMHPAISSFPNAKFYDNQILDGSNVQKSSYKKNYLPGRLYGAYSFINIADGREEKEDTGNSWRNMVEVAVVLKIVSCLYKSLANTGTRISVGVVSPYSAQVEAITEKMSNNYEKCAGFSVKVKSIDGFQGSEEDIIILSTVRANIKGTVGFLDSLNRTNVALTRARHCLWILGNAQTLFRSNTIWEELIRDVRKRGCFFNADEDKGLAKAILDVKHELNQLDDLLNPNSILLSTARWKVLFSDDFRKSFSKLKSLQTRKAVIQVLLRLADGCRPKSKNVGFPDAFQFAKQCRVRELYVVWMVDIVKNEEYIQVLKVWDILPLSEIPKLARRLDSIFAMYTDEYIDLCKMKRIEGKLEVPMTWKKGKDIIRYKKVCDAESQAVPGELDASDNMENSKVSESLLLMKFYSLSSGVAKHLLTANDGKEIELPFEVTDQEQEIIRFPSSTFILGRSGTGKTTVLTMKLIQKEQQHHISSKGLHVMKDITINVDSRKNERREEVDSAKGKSLCQIFVTVSPKLSSAIRSHISRLHSFISGGDFSSSGDSIDMHDVTDSLSDFMDIPDSFIAIPDKHFPLVLTFQKFLMMLDGTMENSFFYKFDCMKDLFPDKRGVSKSLAFQAFIQSKEINYERFVSVYWPHFNTRVTKKLDPSTVFTQIISHIKGGAEVGGLGDGKLSREEYVMLSESKGSPLNREERERIYDIFCDYERKKVANGEFDLSDFVTDLHRRLARDGYAGDRMDFVYIDEVQDLTMRQIALFKYVCRNFQEGFVFAGDTAQTIARGIDFRFQDIRYLFYKEFLSELRSGCKDRAKDKEISVSKIFHLSQNFRTHAGVLKLAQSVVDLLYRFFPMSIDVLSPETSLIHGEAPVILDSGNDENAIITIFGSSGDTRCNVHGFGAEQVILVRDECDKMQVFEHVGKQALVLTIVECKGLEFQDVLLYNFFGASPLKNQWRVIYEYMKEQSLLDSFSPRAFPRFDRSKDNALCSELKQLYVAITRTRQRLWICETAGEYSTPMFEFWEKLCLIQRRHLDSSLAQAMLAASSSEDWRLRGIKLFNEGNFEMATMCFDRAGDAVREKWATAAGLYARADRIISTDFEMARDLLIKAAEIYESIEKAEAAAKCFMLFKAYKRAGILYRDKCGMSKLKEAGDCFLLGKCWSLAADVYARGKFFSECLSACTKGELFDAGLQYVEQWKENSSSDELEKTGEADKIKISFLESVALHYLELGDTKHMMHFVKAFGSLDLIRNFLKSWNFLDALVAVEDEAGNYMEAADIARMKGNVLLEAEMLGKAGNFENASRLILFYVVMNSLWAAGGMGWPLKKFQDKDVLLMKAKSLAEKASSSFYEIICADIDILSDQSYSLITMSKQFCSARSHQNTQLQFFCQRKIIDIHLQLEASKFYWESEIVSDVDNHTEKMMSQNYFSVETLMYFWNLWKEMIMKILSYLRLPALPAENDFLIYEDFCLEYFGVRKKDKEKLIKKTKKKDKENTYVALIPDACWMNGNHGSSIKRDKDLVSMDAPQFMLLAECFWISEVFSVGMKVLDKLHVLHDFSAKKPLFFFQGRVILHMFEVARFLIELESTDSRYYALKLQKAISSCKQCFFQMVFPLYRERALTEGMVGLYNCGTSMKILEEVLTDNLVPKNGKLTHGQIGRVVMLLFVSGSLSDDLCERIKSCLEQMPQWKALIEMLKTYLDCGYGRVSLVSKFQEALQSTFLASWNQEYDYISPHSFMYLVECLLFLVSSLHCYSGSFFTTKLSFFEVFVCQNWKGSLSSGLDVPDAQSQSAIFKSLEFIGNIVQSLLFDKQGMRDWIRRDSYPNQFSYYQSLVLRLVVLVYLAHLNSEWDFPTMTQLLCSKNILFDLPQPFSGILQRSGFGRMKDKRQLLRNLADALATVGNSLMVVGTESNRSKFSNLNAVFVSLEAIQCREDAIGLLILKSPEAVKCNDHTLELDNGDLRKLSSINSQTNDSKDPSTSNASTKECQDLGTQIENESGDIQRLYGKFWKTFDVSEPEKLGNPIDMGNLLPNASSQIKLEVESSICFLNGAMTRINENKLQQDHDGDLSRELDCMLDELQRLSNALDMRDMELGNNISTIGELLAKLRERRPRLEPFLDSLFLPSNNPKTQELPKPTVGPSNQGKGNKAKENNKSRPKKRGKKKK
ncbi:hypothetical protein MRB53_022693 [Persea americana]|uniref:Uncharacterized protein n=1 Tax=Persea americana TaxID=3435 RepID=A0ACC2L7G3_PERAE|nr:hypothetical protein MRB53_022693 [Persea americana]